MFNILIMWTFCVMVLPFDGLDFIMWLNLDVGTLFINEDWHGSPKVYVKLTAVTWEIYGDCLRGAGAHADQSSFSLSFTRKFLGAEIHYFTHCGWLCDDGCEMREDWAQNRGLQKSKIKGMVVFKEIIQEGITEKHLIVWSYHCFLSRCLPCCGYEYGGTHSLAEVSGLYISGQ